MKVLLFNLRLMTSTSSTAILASERLGWWMLTGKVM